MAAGTTGPTGRRTGVPAVRTGSALTLAAASVAEFRPHWSVQSVPTPTATNRPLLYGISCTTANQCTAVGGISTPTGLYGLAEHWRGANWDQEYLVEPPNQSGGLPSVSCASATVCMAVGGLKTDAGRFRYFAELRSEGAWHRSAINEPAGSSAAELFDVSCPTTTSCVAVGFAKGGNGRVRPTASVWSGTQWRRIFPRTPAADAGAIFYGVSCISPLDCTAVGAGVTANGREVPLAERWNGGRWTVETHAVTATTGVLYSVSCVTTGGCVAVGAERSHAGTLAPLRALFLEGRYSFHQPPGPGGTYDTRGYLNRVSCSSATACVAVGSYLTPRDRRFALIDTESGGGWFNQVGATPLGASGVRLYGVSCLASGVCTAVGQWTPATGGQLGFAERT